MEHERILHILEYLTRSTGENKTVTVKDIQTYLAANYGLQSVSALTVRRDLDRLMTSGYDIRVTAGAHNTAHYCLLERGFSFNEIRFLVDSVSINKFLSAEKKRALIKKFEVFCSEDELRRLVSRITLNGQETPSTDLLDNLEKVHDLISARRKINFAYGKYDTNKQMQFYKKSREMIPCSVVYFDDRFYLICVNEKTGEERTYRIDRMREISDGGRASEHESPAKPEGVVLDMFAPERYETVTLRVRRVLLDDMLERLGKYASAHRDPDPEWVQVRARIGISRSFYRWAMEYGNALEVLSPPDVRAGMASALRETLMMYDEQ